MKTPFSLLLVEDDISLRKSLQVFLGGLEGVQTTTLSNADEGISFAKTGAVVNLAIIDFLTHDQFDGYDLALALRQPFPNLPIILITGSDPQGNHRLSTLLSLPNVYFLPKPFLFSKMKTKIQELRKE